MHRLETGETPEAGFRFAIGTGRGPSATSGALGSAAHDLQPVFDTILDSGRWYRSCRHPDSARAGHSHVGEDVE
jgi:hypothetical protein